MAREFEPGSRSLERLCLHTITTKPLPLEVAADEYSRLGIGGISVWKEALAGRDPQRSGARLRDAGLEIVSYVRGGFYPALQASDRQKAVEDNKRLIDEAQALGAPLIVLVCGAAPGQSLPTSRKQILEGIAATIDHAKQAGIRLGIEPLHPMYADTRSAINTLRQANDAVEQLASPQVGVTVDVFHLWWDPDLQSEIQRSANLNALFSYHVCDWKAPTLDMLNDRGLMGEGVINVPEISQWVEDAGFRGSIEVEIFSNTYWAMDQREYLEKIVRAFQSAT